MPSLGVVHRMGWDEQFRVDVQQANILKQGSYCYPFYFVRIHPVTIGKINTYNHKQQAMFINPGKLLTGYRQLESERGRELNGKNFFVQKNFCR